MSERLSPGLPSDETPEDLKVEIANINSEFKETVPFLKPAFSVLNSIIRYGKLTDVDIMRFNIAVARATAVFSLHHLGCPPEAGKFIIGNTIDALDADHLVSAIGNKSKGFAEGLAQFWERHNKPALARRVREVNSLTPSNGTNVVAS